MEWAASPVFHLVLLRAGMGLCVFLFVSLKPDICRLERRGSRAETAWSCAISDQRVASARAFEKHGQEIGELRQEIKEIVERVGLLTPSAPPSTGINLVKRTQVLQLARRGNRPDQIAACLQVPQNEVDLVLKVQRTIVKTF